MSIVELPPEGEYGEVERSMIDNEPPGLFPGDQNSYFGQARKVFADYMQILVDQLGQWWLNLDPRTSDETDLQNWERQFQVPVAPDTLTVEARRAIVMSHLVKGPFTRTARREIVESFIRATFGQPVLLLPEGVPIPVEGIPLFNEETDIAPLYNIVEDIPNFTYDVRIHTGVDLDENGLRRELLRRTPAGISFTITITATP